MQTDFIFVESVHLQKHPRAFVFSLQQVFWHANFRGMEMTTKSSKIPKWPMPCLMCACYTVKKWSSCDPKSQQLLSQVCWYRLEHTNLQPLHEESDIFLTIWRSITLFCFIISHLKTSTQCSTPYLNKSQLASSQSSRSPALHKTYP